MSLMRLEKSADRMDGAISTGIRISELEMPLRHVTKNQSNDKQGKEVIGCVDEEQLPRFAFPCHPAKFTREVETQPCKKCCSGGHASGRHWRRRLAPCYGIPHCNVMCEHPCHQEVSDDHEDHPFCQRTGRWLL